MSFFHDAAIDIRHGFRLLRHRPGLALAAIIPLALGLGAATAMYSVLDGLLLRPAPFPEPDRLVAVWGIENKWKGEGANAIRWDRVVIGQLDYNALRERSHTLTNIAAWSRNRGMLVDAQGSYSLSTEIRVTPSLFELLGLHPALGRVFRPGEDVLNGPAIAMLSYETWQKKFGGDPSIVGRSVTYDEKALTVVGIMPPNVVLDRNIGVQDLWVPAFQEAGDQPAQHNRSFAGLARLAPGATIEQASAEVNRIITEAKIEWNGKADGTAGKALSYQDDQTMSLRPTLLMLSGATALLMLIACVNLAMLMLGEVTRRQPELAARAALGAGPGRLSRQLLAETMVVSLSAATLGAVIGWGLTRVLVALAPAEMTGLSAVQFDLRVFGFVTVAAIVAGVLSGVLPVVAILRWRRFGAGGSGYGQTARGEVQVQRLLVGIEVALCLVMLVGCSLLGRALLKLSAIDPGFASDGLVAVDLMGPPKLWADSASAIAFETAAVRELRGIPGVASVSGSNSGLFNGHWSSSPIKLVGAPADAPGHPVMQHVVLPGFFKTLGATLAMGRDFNEGDVAGATKVAIISAAEARRDFPGVSPIGRLVKWQSEELTIVGVASDVHYTKLDNEDQPTIYVPSTQWAGEWMSYQIRASGSTDASLLIHPIQARLLAINPTLSIQSIAVVPALVRRSYAEEQYRTLLGTMFGLVGTVLAAFGMFGVISRTVARRLREAGIRSALGAPALSITLVMLRETAIGALFGLGAGILMAAWLAKGLTPYLHGIPSFDPAAYGVAIAAFVLAAGVATVPAASRAARVDPAKVLRAEG